MSLYKTGVFLVVFARSQMVALIRDQKNTTTGCYALCVTICAEVTGRDAFYL